MKCVLFRLFLVIAVGFGANAAEPPTAIVNQVNPSFFGIHVVDDVTGRGLPLVEFRTVNDIRCISDNAGWIAFQEPGLMDREIFWHISGPGIDWEKDAFGIAGFRAITKPGTTIEVRMKTTGIATRLGRLTGQGLYRDSELLGLPVPVPNLSEPGVLGQDSVQATPYRGRIFWLWGDTSVARYPLGNFQTTAATTPTNASPQTGLRYEYFTDPSQPDQLRRIMPMAELGTVWMFGLMAVKDSRNGERLFCGYTRQKGLVPPEERGVAEWDESRGIFRSAVSLPKEEPWRFPTGHAVRVTTTDGDYFYFCAPFAYTRVKAIASKILDPKSYEAFTFDESTGRWRWRTTDAPTTADGESLLLNLEKMKPLQARYRMVDPMTGQRMTLHSASIQWNAWRKRFVLIGVQAGDKEAPSRLGEVWYAESPAIDGPWGPPVKIASHPRYSFYNPIHHNFFDGDRGRFLYFEGTYTLEFSGGVISTPRYNYNQLMYRLDLNDLRLKPAQ